MTLLTFDDVALDTARGVCTARLTNPKRRGQRCSNPVMPGGGTRCYRHHEWQPGERGPAAYQVNHEGMIDLGSLWYRSSRVVRFIRGHVDADEETTLLSHGPEWAARRWYAIREQEPWCRLLTVDKLLTHLHLSLYELGDPDVVSSRAPTEAERCGYRVLSYEEALNPPPAVTPIRPVRQCERCGEPVHRAPQARYCSDRCANAQRRAA